MEKNITVVDILSPGRSVQIEFTDNNSQQIITRSKVKRWEELYLVLELPKETDAFNNVSISSNVVIICNHNDEPQDYVFFTKFIQIRNSEAPEVVISKPAEVTMGRHALRYKDVNIPFSYFCNDKEYKGGKVENISNIGLLASIQPNESLKVGLEIPFKIILPNSVSPLLLVGKIVRLAVEFSEYKIALSFPHITKGLQDQITKFLVYIE